MKKVDDGAVIQAVIGQVVKAGVKLTHASGAVDAEFTMLIPVVTPVGSINLMPNNDNTFDLVFALLGECEATYAGYNAKRTLKFNVTAPTPPPPPPTPGTNDPVTGFEVWASDPA